MFEEKHTLLNLDFHLSIFMICSSKDWFEMKSVGCWVESCTNGYRLEMLELHMCNTNHTCFEDNTELNRNHILFPVFWVMVRYDQLTCPLRVVVLEYFCHCATSQGSELWLSHS